MTRYLICDTKSAHDVWMALQDLYGDSSTFDDGKFKKEEDHKEEMEVDGVELLDDLVVTEDCSASTSSSSDGDGRSTTSSLELMDDDCSCSSDNDATTNSPTTLHCFVYQGDAKVSNCNVIDHNDSYDELVVRVASMSMGLENEITKTRKLERENSLLKSSCKQQKHLLYVISCSHEEPKLTHEELSVA